MSRLNVEAMFQSFTQNLALNSSPDNMDINDVDEDVDMHSPER